MRSPSFLEYLGGLINRWRGPNHTRVYPGNSETEFHHLRSKVFDGEFYVTVTSQRIIYHTVYKHWWIRNRFKTVYEVCCKAPNDISKQLSPVLFRPKVYPLLCSRFLKWSAYAHLYAIDAFLENALRSGEFKSIDEIKSNFR